MMMTSRGGLMMNTESSDLASSPTSPMSPAVAPPTPQEIQRKLSVHSASHPAKPSASTTIVNTTVSGTESDSDSIITPDAGISSSHAGVHTASFVPPPLSSIAEQSPGSGAEDSDEEEEEGGWQMGENIAAKNPRGADTTIKSGYLSKKGARRKTWKKRWFVLRPSHLAFYKNEAEYKLLRLLDLSDVHSCTPVHLKRHENAFGLILPKRTYYLQAGSAADAQAWVAAIEEARQTLMATSTQTSTHSKAIPIPGAPTTSTSQPSGPISISPDRLSHQIVNSSDSEDALSQFATPPSPPLPPPPVSVSAGEAQQRLSPQKLTFVSQPKAASPPVSKEGPTVILSGYLMKCGSKRRTWRKRWFVLSSDKLIYSRSHMDTKPHRMFSLKEILDAMDYDMPVHRPHHPTVLAPSVSSTPSHGNSGGYTTGGTSDLSDSQLKNFTFKIVMTKRNLLLCAPSEEDEIKWLGAVRALIARRAGSGALSGQQQQQPQQQPQQPQQPQPQPQQQQQQQQATAMARAESSGGIKSTVRRLSVGTSMLAGGKSTPSPEEEVRDTH